LLFRQNLWIDPDRLQSLLLQSDFLALAGEGFPALIVNHTEAPADLGQAQISVVFSQGLSGIQRGW